VLRLGRVAPARFSASSHATRHCFISTAFHPTVFSSRFFFCPSSRASGGKRASAWACSGSLPGPRRGKCHGKNSHFQEFFSGHQTCHYRRQILAIEASHSRRINRQSCLTHDGIERRTRTFRPVSCLIISTAKAGVRMLERRFLRRHVFGIPQKNRAVAESYFDEHLSHNDYYSQGVSQAGHWIGTGAEQLGLKPGEVVTRDAFLRLCDNQHRRLENN